MDIQEHLPIIVVLGVIGFFLGNIFALKPKAHEMRSADFRLLARQFGFNPKLTVRPDWLPARPQRQNHHVAKIDLVAMYGIINDEWRMTQYRLVRQDGRWQMIGGALSDECQSIINQLPKSIANHALAIKLKANNAALYWSDVRYQEHEKHQLNTDAAKEDLQALHQVLTKLGDCVSMKKA
ncbi:hypothetical protein [Moraxella oculi]|uniref:Uncharacterized protein n=1 Tax=Moraxella oculi TaxID=2940516 RepID=A0ABW8U4C7_9GAMM